MGETITTPRLCIRRFAAQDGPGLHAILSDPQVVRYEPYPPQSHEACAREAARRAGDPAFWAVCLQSAGTLIGVLYLGERAFQARALGYVFRRDAWGQGYATEACRALLDAVFSAGVHRVYAECNPNNVASWRLMERLHMRREAHMVENICFEHTPRPHWFDTYVYAVLRREWPGLHESEG